MSYSPPAIQTPDTPTRDSWTTAGLAVLLIAAVAMFGLLVGRYLDDRHTAGGQTTARTSAGTVQPLAAIDLGGSVHHRSGNQP
jgi:heme/copper-type cytochrome/quinol oxidase subunit 3